MTGLDEDRELHYAEKIAKLRALIENAGTDGEADAAIAQAQALMTRYAISEATIARVRGLEVTDTVVAEQIRYTGIFHQPAFSIARAVATYNDCEHLIITRGKGTAIEVIGMSRDVERVKLLDASLQLQATTAMTRWWRAQDASWMSAMQRFKARRTFLFGFAQGLEAKLDAAQRAGREGAEADVAAQTGQTAAEAAASTELVLIDKRAKAKKWVDEHYGDSLRTVNRSYASGGANARDAGVRAGLNADTGQSGLAGQRRQLGS